MADDEKPTNDELTAEEEARFSKYIEKHKDKFAPSPTSSSGGPSGGTGTNQPTPQNPPQAAPTSHSDNLEDRIAAILAKREKDQEEGARLESLEKAVADLTKQVGARKVRAWFSPMIAEG